MHIFIPQIATGPAVQEFGRDAIKTLLTGANFHIAKPLLATEVRRIMPTAAGLPFELSLYTAAVAAATVQGEQRLESLNSLDLLIIVTLLWNHFGTKTFKSIMQSGDTCVICLLSQGRHNPSSARKLPFCSSSEDRYAA